jgi:hypothetical protein
MDLGISASVARIRPEEAFVAVVEKNDISVVCGRFPLRGFTGKGVSVKVLSVAMGIAQTMTMDRLAAPRNGT